MIGVRTSTLSLMCEFIMVNITMLIVRLIIFVCRNLNPKSPTNLSFNPCSNQLSYPTLFHKVDLIKLLFFSLFIASS